MVVSEGSESVRDGDDAVGPLQSPAQFGIRPARLAIAGLEQHDGRVVRDHPDGGAVTIDGTHSVAGQVMRPDVLSGDDADGLAQLRSDVCGNGYAALAAAGERNEAGTNHAGQTVRVVRQAGNGDAGEGETFDGCDRVGTSGVPLSLAHARDGSPCRTRTQCPLRPSGTFSGHGQHKSHREEIKAVDGMDDA